MSFAQHDRIVAFGYLPRLSTPLGTSRRKWNGMNATPLPEPGPVTKRLDTRLRAVFRTVDPDQPAVP